LGSRNKSTQKIRESIQLIVENNIESIQDSLDLMNPKDKMKFMIDLMKLVLPTVRDDDEIEVVSETPSIDYRSLFNFKES
jgi:vacuolar-type H+-ATPase subunit E/Vma4